MVLATWREHIILFTTVNEDFSYMERKYNLTNQSYSKILTTLRENITLRIKAIASFYLHLEKT